MTHIPSNRPLPRHLHLQKINTQHHLIFLSLMQWWNLSQKKNICIDFIILEALTFEWGCYLEAYSKNFFEEFLFVCLFWLWGTWRGGKLDDKWNGLKAWVKVKNKNKSKGNHWTLVNIKKEIRSDYRGKCINLVPRNILHGRVYLSPSRGRWSDSLQKVGPLAL